VSGPESVARVERSETRDRAGNVKRSRIVDAFAEVGDKMTFLFDYGDNWEFKVELIGHGRKEAGVRYPRPIKTVGKAPEQYPDPDDLDDE